MWESTVMMCLADTKYTLLVNKQKPQNEATSSQNFKNPPTRTYGENLVSKSETSHGRWRVLLDETNKHSLVDSMEADATLALGVLAQHNFSDSYNIIAKQTSY